MFWSGSGGDDTLVVCRPARTPTNPPTTTMAISEASSEEIERSISLDKFLTIIVLYIAMI
jgi:hypothetical protein